MGEGGWQLERLGVGVCAALCIWSLAPFPLFGGAALGQWFTGNPLVKSPTGDASVDSGERKEVPEVSCASIHPSGGSGCTDCSGSSESDSQESPWGQ